MAQNTYYLMHHGVKGMKWGVRRTPEQLGHRTSGSMSDRQVYNTARKVYRLDAKNSSGRGTDRSKYKQMKLEEKLEGHLASRPSDSKKNRELLDRARDKEANRKLNDPEFQRKAAKVAKVALVVGAAYATHKLVNNPQAMAVGKDAIGKVLAKSGNVKASVLNSAMNSTEFKAVKAIGDFAKSGALNNLTGVKAAKGVLGTTGKVLKKIGSEDVRNTVTGIGAMAGTAAILKSQIKDFKENRPEGDTIDRALAYTKKASEIGENVNTLARGPKGATSTSSSNNSSNNSTTTSKNVSVFTDNKTGAPIRANRKLGRAEKDKIKSYRAAHPNMTLAEALDELGWLDKDQSVHHSGIYISQPVWRMKRVG